MFAPHVTLPGITVPLAMICGPTMAHPLRCQTAGSATAKVASAVVIAMLFTGVFMGDGDEQARAKVVVEARDPDLSSHYIGRPPHHHWSLALPA